MMISAPETIPASIQSHVRELNFSRISPDEASPSAPMIACLCSLVNFRIEAAELHARDDAEDQGNESVGCIHELGYRLEMDLVHHESQGSVYYLITGPEYCRPRVTCHSPDTHQDIGDIIIDP